MKIRRKVYSDIQRNAYSVASLYLHIIGFHPHSCDNNYLGYYMTLENLLSKISSFNIADWYKNVKQTSTVASFDDMPADDQLKLQEAVQKFIEPDMLNFDMRQACIECLKLSNEFNNKFLAIDEVEVEFDETLEHFYSYLKKKYGKGEKVTNSNDLSILCRTGIEIPGFRNNAPEHTWQIHLEKIKDHDALIVGEHFSEPNRVWARAFSIKRYHLKERYSGHRFEVIQSMFFEKGFDFETLRVFTKVCEDFFAEVKIEPSVEAV
jgi:hypothetical protein